MNGDGSRSIVRFVSPRGSTRSVFKNAMTRSLSACPSRFHWSTTVCASPPCISMASVSVVARPWCMYGGSLAMPHRRLVRNVSVGTHRPARGSRCSRCCPSRGVSCRCTPGREPRRWLRPAVAAFDQLSRGRWRLALQRLQDASWRGRCMGSAPRRSPSPARAPGCGRMRNR